MKNTTEAKRFSRSINCAQRQCSADRKTISAAALFLLFFAILSTSGCVGTTGAPKFASSQQTSPGAAAISAVPAAIKFGPVALGSAVSQSVTLSNTGATSVTITKAGANGAGLAVTGASFPTTIAAGQQSTLSVVFSPKTAGALSGDLSIVTDASNSPSTVSVSGTGTAASALLTSSISSLSFGTVAVGKSSLLSVTLTNAGNSEITISNVSASGAGYSAMGVSAGLILAAGQSATLQETFAPGSAGSFPGSVNIASNATNSPATIALSGAGAQSGAHSVLLSWTPSDSVVAGYDVFRSQVSGGPYSKLDSSTVTADSYTDPAVQAGQIYYYVVTSVTATGEQSADSAQASATVPTP